MKTLGGTEAARAVVDPEMELLDTAWLDLGKSDVGFGITNDPQPDGKNTPEVSGPPEDRREGRVNLDDYFYFRVTEPAVKASKRLRIRGVFYDDPDFREKPVEIWLQYTNTASTGPLDLINTFKRHPPLKLAGTGGWVTLTWYIGDAGFLDFMQEKDDFRFSLSAAEVPKVCLDRVDVTVVGP